MCINNNIFSWKVIRSYITEKVSQILHSAGLYKSTDVCISTTVPVKFKLSSSDLEKQIYKTKRSSKQFIQH